MQLSCLRNSKINFTELIQSSLSPDGTMNRQQISKIIPYGPDFLFLDSVGQITDKSIVGYYKVLADQPYVKSHFVHDPIMPGCIVAESFAQAGTILIRNQIGESDPLDIYVGKIETARFLSIVKPGNTLVHRVSLQNLNTKMGLARLQGETEVNGKSIALFGVILVIAKRNN